MLRFILTRDSLHSWYSLLQDIVIVTALQLYSGIRQIYGGQTYVIRKKKSLIFNPRHAPFVSVEQMFLSCMWMPKPYVIHIFVVSVQCAIPRFILWVFHGKQTSLDFRVACLCMEDRVKTLTWWGSLSVSCVFRLLCQIILAMQISSYIYHFRRGGVRCT